MEISLYYILYGELYTMLVYCNSKNKIQTIHQSEKDANIWINVTPSIRESLM